MRKSYARLHLWNVFATKFLNIEPGVVLIEGIITWEAFTVFWSTLFNRKLVVMLTVSVKIKFYTIFSFLFVTFPRTKKIQAGLFLQNTFIRTYFYQIAALKFLVTSQQLEIPMII